MTWSVFQQASRFLSGVAPTLIILVPRNVQRPVHLSNKRIRISEPNICLLFPPRLPLVATYSTPPNTPLMRLGIATSESCRMGPIVQFFNLFDDSVPARAVEPDQPGVAIQYKHLQEACQSKPRTEMHSPGEDQQKHRARQKNTDKCARGFGRKRAQQTAVYYSKMLS